MSWKSILGHEFIINSLTSAWKTGRLGHAYLFVGPFGVGKHTLARELAKALLCEDAKGKLEACDHCAACKLVNADTHPDLVMVGRRDDRVEFTIDVLRGDKEKPDEPGLLELLSLKPARGGRTVAILDEADEMNPSAANCFLKMLEEPPPSKVIILVGGSHADVYWPTIVSRCQVIRFAPLSSVAVKQGLAQHDFRDPRQQDRLVQLAGGSLGQALALDDNEAWAFRNELLQTLGDGRIDPAATSQRWMQFIESAGKEPAAARQRAALVVRMFIGFVETALSMSVAAEFTKLDAAERQILRALGKRVGEEKLLAWIGRALEADHQIDRKVQLVLVIEAFVDSLCR